MPIDTAVRATIEKLIEGVQIIGFDWTYLFVNEAAERHARRTASELLGRRMMDCYPGIDETPLFGALQRVMQSREPERFLNDFVYPDGTQGWFELLIEPVPDGICVLSLDVNDKPRGPFDVGRVHRLETVGRLAGGIAHDFDHALTAMLGYCDLVLSRIGGDQDLIADILEIRKAGERASRLTRQLLAFSRRQIVTPEPVDLNEIVHDLHGMLVRFVGDDRRLVLDAAADLRQTLADPGQVEQLLMNLVGNARDATPRGGTVHVSTANVSLDEAFVRTHPGAVAGEYVALRVDDTGHGIEPEVLRHVFEPFYTTKAPGKGTGLGLPTVYGIVKQNGGYVEITSQPGAGTTVTAYLPVAADVLPQVNRRVTDVQTVTGTETVLIVDDDEAMRELVWSILAPHGYTLLVADDVWDAMALAGNRAAPIDLLLTDIVMPGLHGPELARHIVGMHPAVRVLYISGFPQAAVLGAAAMHPRVSFLPKPFGPEILLSAVRDALDDRTGASTFQ